MIAKQAELGRLQNILPGSVGGMNIPA